MKRLKILGAVSGGKHSQSHWMKFPFRLVESHPAASVHTLMRAVCGGYRPIRIWWSLPRHTSHARPSPRRIAAHKHARGHYLIVPPRRDNVDNIFSWLHQSLMRHQGSRQQVTWPQSEWHLGHKASNCCFCCCCCMSCCSV